MNKGKKWIIALMVLSIISIISIWRDVMNQEKDNQIINKDIIKDTKYNDLLISNIDFSIIDGTTIVGATIKNLSEEKKTVDTIYMALNNKDGYAIVRLPLYVGKELDPQEEISTTSSILGEYTKDIVHSVSYEE